MYVVEVFLRLRRIWRLHYQRCCYCWCCGW